jgi:hypothetical protein
MVVQELDGVQVAMHEVHGEFHQPEVHKRVQAVHRPANIRDTTVSQVQLAFGQKRGEHGQQRVAEQRRLTMQQMIPQHLARGHLQQPQRFRRSRGEFVEEEGLSKPPK